jgi:hypothetical protein
LTQCDEYRKWSWVVIADVPFGVVTLTSTVPAGAAGEIAVMVVELMTVTPVAALAPKWTAVAPVKPVPVMVTFVPPFTGPTFGLTFVTVGAVPAGT